jgi:CubicO group peptidase (beta-lactamase class C family)
MVQGVVAAGFESVRGAFERCFVELGETGASFVALVDGRPVADLWGGEGFERGSLVHVYSVTKPMAAFCALVLVNRGIVELDEKLVRYWPEFGQAGKERVTVRQALSHQAGVVALREPQPLEALFDWDRTCSLLAAERPWFEPGTAHAEHALFFGHLCGELVRRVDGRSLGAFWRDEVAIPWGLDFHIGLDEREQRRAVALTGRIGRHDAELYRLATENPPGLLDLSVVNSQAWRAAQIPAVNGHGTAEAIARFYAGLLDGGELDGVRLVSDRIVAAMTAGELTAFDLLLEDETTWGLGVCIWAEGGGYGMAGLGGSIGMADPALGLAQAYVTREMGTHERADTMDIAVRSALATSSGAPR